MVQKKGKRTLVTTLSVLVVLLVAIGVIALLRMTGQDDGSSTKDSLTQSVTTDDSSENSASTDTTDVPDETDTASTLDPETVATIDVPSLAITVSYVKGIGAFEYEALRANNGTRYVEFRSTELIGSKCTDDQGTFASILVSPTEDEKATLASTVTVDATEYGLSLADSTCTSNTEKLAIFQKSFSDAFSLLKKN